MSFGNESHGRPPPEYTSDPEASLKSTSGSRPPPDYYSTCLAEGTFIFDFTSEAFLAQPTSGNTVPFEAEEEETNVDMAPDVTTTPSLQSELPSILEPPPQRSGFVETSDAETQNSVQVTLPPLATFENFQTQSVQFGVEPSPVQSSLELRTEPPEETEESHIGIIPLPPPQYPQSESTEPLTVNPPMPASFSGVTPSAPPPPSDSQPTAWYGWRNAPRSQRTRSTVTWLDLMKTPGYKEQAITSYCLFGFGLICCDLCIILCVVATLVISCKIARSKLNNDRQSFMKYQKTREKCIKWIILKIVINIFLCIITPVAVAFLVVLL